MKLIDIEKIEDCFDGSMIFKYSFAGEIGEMFMRKLELIGELNYYPEFSRPFYKIFTFNGIQIKGIIGETNFEVTFPLTEKWGKKRKFENRLEMILRQLD